MVTKKCQYCHCHSGIHGFEHRFGPVLEGVEDILVENEITNLILSDQNKLTKLGKCDSYTIECRNKGSHPAPKVHF